MEDQTIDQMNYDQLRTAAKEMDIKLPPGQMNIDKLRGMVEDAALERQIRREEKVRAKLKLEAQIRQGIADIQAEAEVAKISVSIPENPTLLDIARLKKELGFKIKEPKPSPEALAIQKSKRVYATFRNLESKDVDIVSCPGGYRFHCWPGRVHCIPEWLVGYHRRQCKYPVYKRVKNAQGNEESVIDHYEPRFLWELHGDAPPDETFGVKIGKTFDAA